MAGRSFVLAAAALLAACAGLDSSPHYTGEYAVSCPRMAEGELRTEIRRDAEEISRTLALPLQTAFDTPHSLGLDIRDSGARLRSDWTGVRSMAVSIGYEQADYPDGFHISVSQPNATGETEAIRIAQGQIQATLKASRCRTWRFNIR
jgi:hypothetical protein